MKPVCVGDEVTIAYRHTDDVLRMHVRGLLETEGFRADNGEATAWRSFADEGVRWIRGHHADDSSEVIALKAANALARPWQ